MGMGVIGLASQFGSVSTSSHITNTFIIQCSNNTKMFYTLVGMQGKESAVCHRLFSDVRRERC